jgi:hypothetical protein
VPASCTSVPTPHQPLPPGDPAPSRSPAQSSASEPSRCTWCGCDTDRSTTLVMRRATLRVTVPVPFCRWRPLSTRLEIAGVLTKILEDDRLVDRMACTRSVVIFLVDEGEYGQQAAAIPACLTAGSEIELSRPDYALPAGCACRWPCPARWSPAPPSARHRSTSRPPGGRTRPARPRSRPCLPEWGAQ